MIYILNKNKTRVIFVQVVLESQAAMFGCKWLLHLHSMTIHQNSDDYTSALRKQTLKKNNYKYCMKIKVK